MPCQVAGSNPAGGFLRLQLQRETLDGFYGEALPLLEKHRQELAQFPDIPLQVNLDHYRSQEKAGVLRIFTARLNRGPADAKTLIGYAVFVVFPNPHYSSSLQAVQDVLYIDPEQRKGATGLGLVNFSEQQLQAEHVQVIYHHVKTAHPILGSILKHKGYAEVETVWAKRLQ
jgi:hypothetical protein